MSNPLILVRTDADNSIGMGHLSRCLTLSRALHSNGARTIFVMRSPSTVVREKVAAVNAVLRPIPADIDLEEDLNLLLGIKRELGASGIIMDGYQFSQTYVNNLANNSCSLCFDELAEYSYNNALVLNQNIHAHVMDYKVSSSTLLLLGARYAVLRPEFAASRKSQRQHPPQAKRLLISFGGSDPHGLSSWALESLVECQARFAIKVILGGESAQSDIVAKLAQAGPHEVDVLHNVSDMASLMNWADLALSASGTNTTLEMSCVGLPMVLIIQAENQRLIGEEMGRQALAVQLGFWDQVTSDQVCQEVSFLAFDQERRQSMSLSLMALVDGQGADRVARRLLEVCGG